MKKLLILCLVAFVSAVVTAQNTGIIPSPQQVVARPGELSLMTASDCKPVKELIASFPVDINADQGYILEVTEKGVLIQALTETGLFYGEQSLKQMLRHFA